MASHLDTCHFFESLSRSDTALYFTTFGLDERILVGILRRSRIDPERRIVVAHDIMKRKYPGLLREHYPRSCVVSVVLKSGAAGCPIFHSKLWMEVDSKRRCLTLSAPSLNLTPFHFDTGSEAFDSFPLWSGICAELPRSPLFSKKIIWRGGNQVQLRMPPESMFVDARDGEPKLAATREESPWQLLNLLRETGEEPRICGAPFLGKRVIRSLFRKAQRDGVKLPVYTGRRNRQDDRSALHAKVIEFGKCVVLGSANLTTQGMGMNGLANHEVVVAMSRGRRSSVRDVLRGFPRAVFDAMDPEGDKGDRDDFDMPEDWTENRRLATTGPRFARLSLSKSDCRAEVNVDGRGLGGTARIEVVGANGDQDNDVLSMKASTRLRFRSESRQADLAQMILPPPAVLRGVSGNGDVRWQRPLDYGALWTLLEVSPGVMHGRSGRVGVGGSRPPRRGEASDTGSDVRVSRQSAWESSSSNQVVTGWAEWLGAYSARHASAVMPQWCLALRNHLRRDADA